MSYDNSYGMKPNMNQEISLQLEEPVASHSDVNNKLQGQKNFGRCSDLVDVKLEIKEEDWWENKTADSIHHSETKFEFVPQLKINKEDTFSEENSIYEDVQFPESPRLMTEAVYNDGSGICTSVVHCLQNVCQQVPEVDFDAVNTIIGRNVNKECSKRHNNCVRNFDTEDEYNLTSDKSKQLHKCQFCMKSFKYKSLLEGHALSHSDTKPYRCNMCDKSFKRKTELNRHTLIHFDTKPYKCDICKKSFSSKQILKQHIFSHSGSKPYKCDSCERSFNRRSALARHSFCHSGIRPFKCDSCETTFYQKSDLKKHVLWHSGTKPYECDMCDRKFSNKSNLTKHIFCHSGSKPYKCDICVKSFNRKSALTRHSLCHFRFKTIQM